MMTCHSITRDVLINDALRRIGSLLIAVGMLQNTSLGQLATLQITSPKTGGTVVRGQQFTVSVSIGGAAAFDGVMVIGEKLPVSPVFSKAPFTFAFTAPDDPGRIGITAVGIKNGEAAAFSQTVVVSVETRLALSQLLVQPARLPFAFVGQQLPLIVTGTFVDGTRADLTQSSQISYSSTDASVAQVTGIGVVTATGYGANGAARISVMYQNHSKVIEVRVPKTIRGDLNGDGRIDVDDLNIILDALNTSATRPVDARDLNDDGVINGLDSRNLVTLCLRLGCATQ